MNEDRENSHSHNNNNLYDRNEENGSQGSNEIKINNRDYIVNENHFDNKDDNNKGPTFTNRNISFMNDIKSGGGKGVLKNKLLKWKFGVDKNAFYIKNNDRKKDIPTLWLKFKYSSKVEIVWSIYYLGEEEIDDMHNITTALSSIKEQYKNGDHYCLKPGTGIDFVFNMEKSIAEVDVKKIRKDERKLVYHIIIRFEEKSLLGQGKSILYNYIDIIGCSSTTDPITENLEKKVESSNLIPDAKLNEDPHNQLAIKEPPKTENSSETNINNSNKPKWALLRQKREINNEAFDLIEVFIAEEGEGDPEENLCLICISQKPDCVLLPWRHMVIDYEWAQLMINGSKLKKFEWPLWRTIVEEIIHVKSKPEPLIEPLNNPIEVGQATKIEGFKFKTSTNVEVAENSKCILTLEGDSGQNQASMTIIEGEGINIEVK